jgi:hypothetical protein
MLVEVLLFAGELAVAIVVYKRTNTTVLLVLVIVVNVIVLMLDKIYERRELRKQHPRLRQLSLN